MKRVCAGCGKTDQRDEGLRAGVKRVLCAACQADGLTVEDVS